jgi:hypothetical protein
MNSIKTREVLILFVALTIFINLIFFKYIQNSLNKKIIAAQSELSTIENNISEELLNYSQNMKIFKDLTYVKSQIIKYENKLKILQSKITSDVQISQVIKALIQKNGTVINKIKLKKSLKDGFKRIFYFEVEVEGNVQNLIKLINKIEENNDFLKIDKYVWDKKDNSIKLNMDISTVFIEVENES